VSWTWIIDAVLLGLAVVTCLLSGVGALLMHNPLQRIHFLSPPATVSAYLIVLALLVHDFHDWQAVLKTIVIATALTFVNGVLTHATARAALHHMAARPRQDVSESVPLVDAEGTEVGEVNLSGPTRRTEDVSPWT